MITSAMEITFISEARLRQTEPFETHTNQKAGKVDIWLSSSPPISSNSFSFYGKPGEVVVKQLFTNALKSSLWSSTSAPLQRTVVTDCYIAWVKL